MCSDIAALEAALDALPEPDPACPAGLAEDVVGLRRLVERVQVAYLTRLAILDRASSGSVGGTSTVDYVASEAAVAQRVARREAFLARSLFGDEPDRQCPRTAELLCAGELSVAQAEVIARTMHRLHPDEVANLEATVAQVCAETAPSATDRICRHTTLVAGDDRSIEREERLAYRRFLHIQPCGDMVLINGQLTAEDGAVVGAAVHALTTWDRAEIEGPGARRHRSQLRADALVELARRQLRSESLPSGGGEAPQIHVTIGVDDLVRGVGTGSVEGTSEGTLTAHAVRRIACDAAIDWTLIEDPSAGGTRTAGSPSADPPDDIPSWPIPGFSGHQPPDPALIQRLLRSVPPALGGLAPVVLAAGRAKRIVPASLRKALARRDQGCAYPGCDRPPDWCQAHHLRHWANGGTTDAENLVLVCTRHHTLLHIRGETLVRGEQGYERRRAAA